MIKCVNSCRSGYKSHMMHGHLLLWRYLEVSTATNLVQHDFVLLFKWSHFNWLNMHVGNTRMPMIIKQAVPFQLIFVKGDQITEQGYIWHKWNAHMHGCMCMKQSVNSDKVIRDTRETGKWSKWNWLSNINA